MPSSRSSEWQDRGEAALSGADNHSLLRSDLCTVIGNLFIVDPYGALLDEPAGFAVALAEPGLHHQAQQPDCCWRQDHFRNFVRQFFLRNNARKFFRSMLRLFLADEAGDHFLAEHILDGTGMQLSTGHFGVCLLHLVLRPTEDIELP